MERILPVDKGAYEFLLVSSSTDLNQSIEQLNIHPNPALEWLNLTLENKWVGKITVEIRDASAREILLETHVKSADDMTLKLDINHLESGIYLVSLYHNAEIISKSFLKH